MKFIPDAHRLFTGRYGFPFHGWQPLELKATILASEFVNGGYVNHRFAARSPAAGQARGLQ